jgi:hypothetical protein
MQKGKLQLTDSAVKVPSSAVGITVAKNAVRTYPPRLESYSHHHEDIRACYESTSIEGRFDHSEMSHLYSTCVKYVLAQQTAAVDKSFILSE